MRSRSPKRNSAREAAILPARVDPTRDRAWETLTRYTKSESLLRHALAVEASTRFYARKFGEDEELWGVAALLHDFDYEIHPTLDKHPQDGAPILREEGYPEEIVETVLSHAEHLALPRDTLLKKTLFACDELSGFVHACGLVRPTGLEGLEPKSVRKKLKQPSFAAGVHRDEVYKGAEELGVELDEHIRNVVAALQPIAGELGLRTARRGVPSSGQRGDQPLDVVVARPPAARRAEPRRAGMLRTTTPSLEQASRRPLRGSPSTRNVTRPAWPGGVTTARVPPAPRGSARPPRAIRSKRHSGARPSAVASPFSDATEIQPGSNRCAPSRGT